MRIKELSERACSPSNDVDGPQNRAMPSHQLPLQEKFCWDGMGGGGVVSDYQPIHIYASS